MELTPRLKVENLIHEIGLKKILEGIAQTLKEKYAAECNVTKQMRNARVKIPHDQKYLLIAEKIEEANKLW